MILSRLPGHERGPYYNHGRAVSVQSSTRESEGVLQWAFYNDE